jgi:hypothetical protein
MSTPRIDHKQADELIRSLIDAVQNKYKDDHTYSYAYLSGLLSSILTNTLAGRTIKDVKQTILDIQNLTKSMEQ